MYACIGLGALAKGPVGVVLPIAAFGVFLLFNDGWRNLPHAVWNMRPITGILVLALVALPWYIEVGRRTEWVWPRQFLLEFNLRPFQQPILGHGDTSSFDRLLAALVSFLYYFYQIPAILIGFPGRFSWRRRWSMPCEDCGEKMGVRKKGKKIVLTPFCRAHSWPHAGSAHGSCCGPFAKRNCRTISFRPIRRWPC
jgi:4-amino-4-deoxy-L-arabinose transferase-like glycosyltransferase